MLQRVIRSDSDQKKPSEKKCPFFFGTVQFFLGSIVHIVGGTRLLDDNTVETEHKSECLIY